MKKLAVMGLLLSLSALSSAKDVYTFDQAHTTLGFSVKHMMVSRVDGAFRDFNGTITLDEEDLTKSSVNVTIQVASVNTGNDKRDEHLKNSDFFDAPKFPLMTFKSTKIIKTPTGYEATGLFTMKDVSKEITIPFILNGPVENPFKKGEKRIGVEGGVTINRQDYHVTWNMPMMDGQGVIIGNDVKITLNVEATKNN